MESLSYRVRQGRELASDIYTIAVAMVSAVCEPISEAFRNTRENHFESDEEFEKLLEKHEIPLRH